MSELFSTYLKIRHRRTHCRCGIRRGGVLTAFVGGGLGQATVDFLLTLSSLEYCGLSVCRAAAVTNIVLDRVDKKYIYFGRVDDWYKSDPSSRHVVWLRFNSYSDCGGNRRRSSTTLQCIAQTNHFWITLTAKKRRKKKTDSLPRHYSSRKRE